MASTTTKMMPRTISRKTKALSALAYWLWAETRHAERFRLYRSSSKACLPRGRTLAASRVYSAVSASTWLRCCASTAGSVESGRLVRTSPRWVRSRKSFTSGARSVCERLATESVSCNPSSSVRTLPRRARTLEPSANNPEPSDFGCGAAAIAGAAATLASEEAALPAGCLLSSATAGTVRDSSSIWARRPPDFSPLALATAVKSIKLCKVSGRAWSRASSLSSSAICDCRRARSLLLEAAVNCCFKLTMSCCCCFTNASDLVAALTRFW